MILEAEHAVSPSGAEVEAGIEHIEKADDEDETDADDIEEPNFDELPELEEPVDEDL